MKKVAIIGCGAYMDSGYGCPGEWRCLKAAALGDGKFDSPSAVVAFVKCECPGRTLVPNMGMAMKLSEIKPDVIHLSSCRRAINPPASNHTADIRDMLLNIVKPSSFKCFAAQDINQFLFHRNVFRSFFLLRREKVQFFTALQFVLLME